MTKYPTAIDDSISLPVITDKLTPVKSSTVNNLRSAIIAIEAELGVNPKSVYGSVKNRLDILETTVNVIGNNGAVFWVNPDVSIPSSNGSLNYPFSTLQNAYDFIEDQDILGTKEVVIAILAGDAGSLNINNYPNDASLSIIGLGSINVPVSRLINLPSSLELASQVQTISINSISGTEQNIKLSNLLINSVISNSISSSFSSIVSGCKILEWNCPDISVVAFNDCTFNGTTFNIMNASFRNCSWEQLVNIQKNDEVVIDVISYRNLLSLGGKILPLDGIMNVEGDLTFGSNLDDADAEIFGGKFDPIFDGYSFTTGGGILQPYTLTAPRTYTLMGDLGQPQSFVVDIYPQEFDVIFVDDSSGNTIFTIPGAIFGMLPLRVRFFTSGISAVVSLTGFESLI